MARRLFVLPVLILIGCGSKPPNPPPLVDLPDAATPGKLTVTSDAVPADGKIPVDFTASGVKKMPMISWSGAPADTKEFEILIEDPEASHNPPFIHLYVTGIPGDKTSWVGDSGTIGPNTQGSNSYAPLDPPAGETHHYHFEVFALSKPLSGAPATREGLLAAMKGPLVAKGDLIGTFGK